MTKKRLLIVVLICLILLVIIAPFETSVIPQWRVQVVDVNGYVQFPERMIEASLLRRIIMPIVTRMTTIMHGGWKIDGAVWAAGIKDVAWLSYESGKPMPEIMRVEKCERREWTNGLSRLTRN